jgi:antitoxin (DNA-binding transcriptional repressor) of toxin-antitoxin stability system
MTKVNIREFRSHLGEYLKNLPITITNRDKPIAIVYTPQDNPNKEIDLLKAYIKELESQLENNKEDRVHNVEPFQEYKKLILDKCEHPGCKSTAVGVFNIIIHDWELGDIKKDAYLCDKHRRHYEKGDAENSK